MKRLNLFLVGLVALTLVFTSCEPTENAAPVISFTNGVTEATTDQSTYTVSGTITSEAGLESVTFTKETTAGTDQLEVVTSFTDKSNYQFQKDVTVSEDMTLIVKAVDKDGNETARNFMITYTGGAGSIATYTKTLGSYNASTGSSFASIDGTVYKWADATANSEKVDFLYFYGASNKATIASPDDSDAESVFSGLSSWGTQNATKFGITTLTETEFDAITDDTEILANTSSLSSSKVNDLAVGDVFAFKTASTSAHANKAGLAKVTSISKEASDGEISIVVKVQE